MNKRSCYCCQVAEMYMNPHTTIVHEPPPCYWHAGSNPKCERKMNKTKQNEILFFCTGITLNLRCACLHNQLYNGHEHN